VGLAERVRIMGSLALALCHLADGRVDAVATLREVRAIDIAAAQLLCRERGVAVALPGLDAAYDAAPLDLVARARIVAAATPELRDRLARALTG
jgi:myo-inositol-1(or 4)-monophosphatase